MDMLKRTVARGLIAIAFLTLVASAVLVISPPIASAQTAIAAGEDDSTPPTTDTQPTTPAPVPVAPAPPAPATPAPAAPKPKPKAKHKAKARKARPVALETLVPTRTVSTQTVPQGGIQAGEGGTAPHGPSGLLLGLGSGVLAFGLVAVVQARRRRSIER